MTSTEILFETEATKYHGKFRVTRTATGFKKVDYYPMLNGSTGMLWEHTLEGDSAKTLQAWIDHHAKPTTRSLTARQWDWLFHKERLNKAPGSTFKTHDRLSWEDYHAAETVTRQTGFEFAVGG